MPSPHDSCCVIESSTAGPDEAFFSRLLGEVSGMRRGELHDDGTWHLPGSRTKNHRPHIVPLCPLVRELIGNVPLIEGCPYVFSTTGKTPISGWSKTKAKLDAVMLALAKKEIDAWTFHDLRRTAVTGMANLGIAPRFEPWEKEVCPVLC